MNDKYLIGKSELLPDENKGNTIPENISIKNPMIGKYVQGYVYASTHYVLSMGRVILIDGVFGDLNDDDIKDICFGLMDYCTSRRLGILNGRFGITINGGGKK